jgi:hypothetical protein
MEVDEDEVFTSLVGRPARRVGKRERDQERPTDTEQQIMTMNLSHRYTIYPIRIRPRKPTIRCSVCVCAEMYAREKEKREREKRKNLHRQPT